MSQDVTQSNVAGLRDRVERIERILLVILDGHYEYDADVKDLLSETDRIASDADSKH